MDTDIRTADAALTTASAPVPAAAAERFAAAHFGVVGRAEPLGGERDANIRIMTANGPGFVLKIANPAEPRANLELQIAALRHVAARDPDLPAPRPRGGIAVYEAAAEPPRFAWMVSYLPGRLLPDVAATPALRRDVGRVLARLTRALGDFSHPAAARVLLWDLKQAGRLAALVGHIRDVETRAHVAALFARFAAEVAPRFATLPAQAVHADFNAHNLIADPETERVAGILDFGDLVRTARVADLAVAASYHVGVGRSPLAPAMELVAGYAELVSLTTAEQAVLPALIATRLAMTITISEWRAALYPDNSVYILRNNTRARQRLAALRADGHA